MASDDEIPHTHAGPSRRQPMPPPGSQTDRFVKLVRESHGEDFVASWLLPHLTIKMSDGQPAFQNCEFTHDTIFTTGVGADALRKRCEHLVEKADIEIRECPVIRQRFNVWGRKYAKQKTIGGKK